jgi:hypothetical protein
LESKIFEEILEVWVVSDSNKPIWDELAVKYHEESGEKLRSKFKRERQRRNISSKEEYLNTHGVRSVSNDTKSEEIKQPEMEKEKTTYQEGENYINIICSSPRIVTKDDVIKHFNIDTNIWRVKEFTVKTSEGYRKDRSVQWEVENGTVINGKVNDTGKMLIVPMYHTETKMVRRNEFTFEDVDKFFKNFSSEKKSEYVRPKNFDVGGKILEIDLADMHVGNASVFGEETSIETKCAFVIDKIIAKCKNVRLEKIVLVNLGDLLHYDTFKQTTTSGTNVTANMDLSTIFEIGAKILINTIDKLVQIAPVEVIGIYGNHDQASSFMLTKAIEFYYRENDCVYVDAGHLPRKFRRFGNCLVMWSHGDLSKNNTYSLIQREARKEFGETKFAEIHCGHFHSQSTTEKDGVIIRYLPTMTPTDAWHFGEGYTGALRSTVSFLWDKELGLEEMWFVNV